jgi:hypothetical protein
VGADESIAVAGDQKMQNRGTHSSFSSGVLREVHCTALSKATHGCRTPWC